MRSLVVMSENVASIKSMFLLDSLRIQQRKGKGAYREGIKNSKLVIVKCMKESLLSFTSTGRVIVNMERINLSQNEKFVHACSQPATTDEHIFIITKRGIIKKTPVTGLPKFSGKVISLMDGDMIADTCFTGHCHGGLAISTKKGKVLVISPKQIRETKRTSVGSKGITLAKDDEVTGITSIDYHNFPIQVLTVTKNGYGKRTDAFFFPSANRGGRGVIGMKASERNGEVIGVEVVSDKDEIILVSNNGFVLRIKVADIPCIGRNTQGVALQRLGEGDYISYICVVRRRE